MDRTPLPDQDDPPRSHALVGCNGTAVFLCGLFSAIVAATAFRGPSISSQIAAAVVIGTTVFGARWLIFHRQRRQ
jgi:hypothetical protein